MSNLLKLYAFDTLLFGSGRPFTRGNDSWASTIFPPFPNTLYGLLRGSYFSMNMEQFKDVDKDGIDPTNYLEILDYGLELEEKDGSTEVIYPLPLDYVQNKSNKTYIPLSLEKTDKEIISNYESGVSMKLIYKGKEKIRGTDGSHYIKDSEMDNYLNGNEITKDSPFLLKDCFVQEPKIGICRDRFKTENKELFRISLTRPENKESQRINFWIEFEGIDLPKNMISRLGGEGKLVSILNTSVEEEKNDFCFVNGDIVKIYLASPAIFPDGWKPKINGAELISGVIGKPRRIGGWDVQKKLPKFSKKTVPAGSVYYYKINETESFLKSVKPMRIGENTDMGFGIIKIAKHILTT
jgi:CRISPR-associated protein Cmr3